MPAADDRSKAAERARRTAVRRARPAAEMVAARAAITAHVLARVAAAHWHTVAAYDPLPGEPGSRELLEGLSALDVRVLLPVTLPDRDLDWRPVGESAALGVSAVVTADCVLAPALAVATDGTRLGRGGGSYDRALARVPASCVVAALLFDDELVDELPADPWDVPVTAVVTPSGWRELRGGRARNTAASPGG